MTAMADPRFAAVEDYLARGWKLFVLNPNKTTLPNCHDCRTAGLGHDMESCPCLVCHGFYAATSDPQRLARMFGQRPDGIIGVRTGAASGITVVDAESTADRDDLPTGVEVLDDWESWTGFTLPPTMRARTASGGVHFVYDTGDHIGIRSRNRVLPGVDVKSNGGYVALPPGVSGERAWLPGQMSPTRADGPLLDWLLSARGRVASGGSGGTPSRAASYSYERCLREGPEVGEQNVFLNDLLFRLIKAGETDPHALYARVWPMIQMWKIRPGEPWRSEQVIAKIASMIRSVEPDAPLPEWNMGEEPPTPRVSPAIERHWARLEVTQGADGPPTFGTDRRPPFDHDAGAEDDGEPSERESDADVADELAARRDDARRAYEAVVVPVVFAGDERGRRDDAPDEPPGGDPPHRTFDHIAEPPRFEDASDTGNSMRFARIHGERVRYITQSKQWLIWDGNRWKRDEVNRVMDMTRDVAHDVAMFMVTIPEDQRNPWLRNLDRTKSSAGRDAMLRLAATLPEITVRAQDMDADPMILVVKNGVIDLRTGEIRAGRPEDLCTYQADVAYDPDATCPQWLEHVKFTACEDPLLMAYLQRVAGYSLTGLTTEHAFFSFEGDGANGKNAFIEPLMYLMGDYATVSSSKLVTQGDRAHAAIVADLVGKRMVFVDEVPQDRHIDVERVKTLTGSGKMKAQFMRENWFEFTPQMKLWLAGNGHPHVKDTSDGVWRRMKRIMFNAKITGDRKITDFARIMFRDEAPGILNWCLAGLAQWRALGTLAEPSSISRDTENLRDEENPVRSFVADCIEITGDENDYILNGVMRDAFAHWCQLQAIDLHGVRPESKVVHIGREMARLTKDLPTCGPFNDRRAGTKARGYQGVRLRDAYATGGIFGL